MKNIIDNYTALDGQVFNSQFDKHALFHMVKQLGNIQLSFLDRDEFNQREWEGLIDYSVQYNDSNSGDIISNMKVQCQKVLEGKKQIKSHIFYIPNDLCYGELLAYIDIFVSTFWIETYSKMNELLIQTKIIAATIIRELWEEEWWKYISALTKKYNISNDLINRITHHKISCFESKKIIKRLKNKRINVENKAKLGQEEWDHQLWLNYSNSILWREFDLNFLRDWVNCLRFGMDIMTQSEHDALMMGTWEKMSWYFSQWANYKKGTISSRRDTEILSKKEKKLRDAIWVDNLKVELDNARKEGNKTKIEELEFTATEKILQELVKYPYQFTDKYYWDKPKMISKYKEVQCVGFSILGHTFLSELWIHHQWLDIWKHSALEINIWDKKYYFDWAAKAGKIFQFTYWEKNGEWILLDGFEISWKHVYAIPWDTESILMGQIYWNLWVQSEVNKLEFSKKAVSYSPLNPLAHMNHWNDLIRHWTSMIDQDKWSSYINQWITYCQNAITLNWNNPEYSFQFWGMHNDEEMKWKYFKDAEKKARIMCEIDPDNVEWFEYLAHSLILLWKQEESREVVQKILQMNNYDEASTQLWHIYLEQWDYEKAFNIFVKNDKSLSEECTKKLWIGILWLVTEGSITMAEFFYKQGQIHLLENKLVEATEKFKAAVKEEPNNPDYLLSQWKIFLERWNLWKALIHLEKILNYWTKSWELCYYLWLSYSDSWDYEKAIQFAAEAHVLEPDNKKYVQSINKILEKVSFPERTKLIYKRNRIFKNQ